MSQIIVRFSYNASEHLSVRSVVVTDRSKLALHSLPVTWPLTQATVVFALLGHVPCNSREDNFMRLVPWFIPTHFFWLTKGSSGNLTKVISVMQERPVPECQSVSSSERWQ